MRGFTGILDQDREILLKLNKVKDLLTACSLNKYMNEKVCNDTFFLNALRKFFPKTEYLKKENETWKSFFLKYVYYTDKLISEFGKRSRHGVPRIIYPGRDVEADYKLLSKVQPFTSFRGRDFTGDRYLNKAIVVGNWSLAAEAFDHSRQSLSQSFAMLIFTIKNANFIRENYPNLLNKAVEIYSEDLSQNDVFKAISLAKELGEKEIVEYLETLV